MEYSQDCLGVNFCCGGVNFCCGLYLFLLHLAKNLWGQEDLNQNTDSATYSLGPLSKNYIILETVSLVK